MPLEYIPEALFDDERFFSFLYRSGVDELDLICVDDAELDEPNELALDIVNFGFGMDRLAGFIDALRNLKKSRVFSLRNKQ